MNTFAPILLFAAFAYFALKRSLRYLHIFQQEDYNPQRFLHWVIATRSFDRRLSITLAIMALATSWGSLPSVNDILLTLIFAAFAAFEADPRQTAKKKLVLTHRATRILVASLLLQFIAASIVISGNGVFAWIWVIQGIPFAVALANIMLIPVENYIQAGIRAKATAHLLEVAPQIIGITGSFGKTSVKHILGHILEMEAPTLFTPGSVNTLMGICRIINERLKSGCRFFIVEMGAYGVGSIKRLCGLTPPTVGILTAIGEAHYERFKTLDAVARAKFELAEAALSQPNGKMIIHESVLAQEYARNFVAARPDKFIVCGSSETASLKIGTPHQTVQGLSIPVTWQSKDYMLFAPLYGEAHAGNIALAFATAVTLGITPERATAALRTTPQIKHRLEVKPQADGITYIDDAFNSNPHGFAAALDILAMLGSEKNGRRILVTPGMVELGSKHAEAHRDMGTKAAQTADIVLAVRADKIPTFIEAFKKNAPEKLLQTVPSFTEARQWLTQYAQTNDVILIENDLPDLGETRLSL